MDVKNTEEEDYEAGLCASHWWQKWMIVVYKTVKAESSFDGKRALTKMSAATSTIQENSQIEHVSMRHFSLLSG